MLTTDIIIGIVGLAFAVYFTLYLKGKLNFSTEQESKRKERIQKYGSLLKLVTVLAYIFSVGLILSSIVG